MYAQTSDTFLQYFTLLVTLYLFTVYRIVNSNNDLQKVRFWNDAYSTVAPYTLTMQLHIARYAFLATHTYSRTLNFVIK